MSLPIGEKMTMLARFLISSNGFRVLHFMSKHPDGVNLDQISDSLKLSKPVVLAVLHEAWELGLIEPVESRGSTTTVSSRNASSEDTSNSDPSLNDNFELPLRSSLADGSLIEGSPLLDYLERQNFLIAASTFMKTLNANDMPGLDVSSLGPVMKETLTRRIKYGVKTSFHLTPWVRELFSRISSLDEMKEYLRQQGLLG